MNEKFFFIFSLTFSFKLTELDDVVDIPCERSIPFMLLWHCVLPICNAASSEPRSIYAKYLLEEKFDQTLSQILFRMMSAREVLLRQEIDLPQLHGNKLPMMKSKRNDTHAIYIVDIEIFASCCSSMVNQFTSSSKIAG